jgi:hypothetical protein
MAIIVKAGPDFIPAPEGSHIGVLVDVVELGLVSTTYNGKTKSKQMVKLVWQIAEIRPDNGKPFTVSCRYNRSLHKKATLRRDLESLRGRAFTDSELKAFDLETLIGSSSLLNVVHVIRDGVTYGNVSSIMQLPKGMTPLEPRDYVRVKDRQEQNGAFHNSVVEKNEEPKEASPDGISDDDDDVPY